jgi:RNA polymerase sigma factor (sigma-70 family)
MVIEAPKADLSTPEFYAKNNDLAGRYKLASPSARQNIVLELYRLDLKLFQAWRVLGEDREDYQQEAALWLTRALETYKPDKGPFVNWLRGYIQNTFRHHVKTHKKKAESLDDSSEVSDTGEETRHDPLFWKAVKAQVTPEEWSLIVLRFHDGKTITEIAKLKGTYADKIRAPLLRAINAIKAASLSSGPHFTENVSGLDDVQSCWIAPAVLAQRLGLDLTMLLRMISAKGGTGFTRVQVDPRDVVKISRQRIRVRFLETDKGLIYPRFIQRSKVVGRAGYL